MQRLHLFGLNHTTAPLEVRERLAFNSTQRLDALKLFRERFPGTEAVLLSTCNRVELYIAREGEPRPGAEAAAEFLAEFHGATYSQVRPHLYHRSQREMVEHLFNVASSLDSMVLGETQILGQVRDAYEAAQGISSTGPLLNPLFQRAIAVGKQVTRETTLNEGRLSIASVAVDFSRRIFDHFNDKAVLSIGAGKMAALVLRSFAGLSPRKLWVCNRDSQKAEALARQFNGEPAAFEQLDEHLASVDIVITSTGSTEPIITAKRFAAAHRRRRYRPIFLIDIALPRDVEPEVGELENVYLYNLDDLQQVVSQTQAGRHGAIDSARAIVNAAVDDFARSIRTRAIGPVIDQLYKRHHQLAQEELNRTLNKLPNLRDEEKQHLEELTRRIVNKLLHQPVHTLRQADAQHAPAHQYLHALEQLFKLHEEPAEGAPAPTTDENPADPNR